MVQNVTTQISDRKKRNAGQGVFRIAGDAFQFAIRNPKLNQAYSNMAFRAQAIKSSMPVLATATERSATP